MSLRSVIVTGSRLPAGNSGRRGRGTASTCRRMAPAQGRVLEKGMPWQGAWGGARHSLFAALGSCCQSSGAAIICTSRRSRPGTLIPLKALYNSPVSERVLESGTLGRNLRKQTEHKR